MIDIGRLQELCAADENSFAALGDVNAGVKGTRLLVHIDRGSDVLGVAHLDTVHDATHFFHSGPTPDRVTHVWSPCLDNRLGVHIILDVLPSIGVECDVLLTTDEEFMDSTAREFMPEKEYNWMFSFDRRGSGVVMYRYETALMTALLRKYRIRVDQGSYSDIAELWFLGVTGFNFGNGVINEHYEDAMALLRVTEESIRRFTRFYNDFAQQPLLYEPSQSDIEFFRQSAMTMYTDDEMGIMGDEAWDYCDFCDNLYHVTELDTSNQYNAKLCGNCARMVGGGWI